jgi:hypothetical protein
MANPSGTVLRDASTIEASGSVGRPATAGNTGGLLDESRDPEKERLSLLFEMKVTKGSRFNAAERLRRRDRTSTMIVSFASAYVIVLTIIPVIFHIPEFVASIITLAIIVFSIVILTYSLIQYSSSDPVKAEQHHRCAIEINALRRELRVQPVVTFESLTHYAKEYDELLQRYSINHEPVDYETYKIEHPDEYPAPVDKEAMERDVKKENGFYVNVLGSMTVALLFPIVAIMANYVYNLLERSGIFTLLGSKF